MTVLRCAVFFASLPLLAQQYTFEVASVKPSNPPSDKRNWSSFDTAGNGLRATNVSAMQLIRLALNAQDYQISGGPGWLRDDRFDVTTRNDVTEADIPRSDRKGQQAQVARMQSRVRHLLEERFGLVIREQMKELPAWVLTVDKGGLKLKASESTKGNIRAESGKAGASLRAEGISIDNLCEHLAGVLERPVVDETGLDGVYDFELKYALETSATGKEGGDENLGPSLFTAVRETLGLRLTAKKASVKSWVIESIRKPTEN
ncbi:MAG: hypothetical protein JWN34_2452 [Bryobacterales bacterium]|nr:hypothetical protein [Bryobacterales bacterium]